MNEDAVTTSSTRLIALDFLRGLVLTFVLVDHIDDLIFSQEFFTRWTLKGLGISDAAEAFVFLSGFTFGWVYSPRLERDGLWSCERRALVRTVVIWFAMLLTTVLVSGLAWSIRHTTLVFRLPLTIQTPAMFAEAFLETAKLRELIWGIGILVVYVCVLPFLPLMLWLARRSTVAALAVTLLVYTASQVVPALQAGDAGFNPLAWQVLAVIGVLIGDLSRRGVVPLSPGRWAVVPAAFVLVAGLVAMRSGEFAPSSREAQWIEESLIASPLFSKTNLGPARLVHFAALAIVTAAAMRRWPQIPQASWARPFVRSGRHSLPLFCLGVILAYLSALASAFLPDHLVSLLLLAAVAVLLQFAAARLLDARSPHTQHVSRRR